MNPDRFYPQRPTAERWKFRVGEVRYTHNGQRHIILSCGWADNQNGFILPFGTNVGVASDCGWIWEPRAYPATELLSAVEYADHALKIAAHLRCRANEWRVEADNSDRQATRLENAAAALTATVGSPSTLA